MKRWTLIAALALTFGMAVLAGCSTLDEKQRDWIFQPSDRTWGGGLAAAEGMQDIWINFSAAADKTPATLHGLWLPAGQAEAPILLYLHGARYNVTGSAQRIRRMQELGFSVLAVDYRGFGKSTAGLPSEQSAYEDARVAWNWLRQNHPKQARYIFGHSLGGPIAIELATEVDDEAGTIVEGSFTSIADVVSSSRWGWIPVSSLITQRFEAARKVSKIGSPLLVVHGDADRTIRPELGKKLFDAALQPKRFELVKGGSHHNTNAVGQAQYRLALAQLFSLK
jgi:alpha-beta hydrolase superfamily lysophospholipase